MSEPDLSRRALLRWPFVALLPPRFVLAADVAPGAVTFDPGPDFDAFVDTLLPADGAPGALDLNIPQKLRLLGASDHDRRLLLTAGTEALMALARRELDGAFHGASLASREALVERIERAEPGAVLRRYFERVRLDSFAFYYSDPRSWPSLGFQGSPQPNGYPDFARAPK